MAAIEGKLVRVPLNIGSKSEQQGFAIQTTHGEQIVVEKEGDNPFEHESLRPLVKRRVRAIGEMYRGRFIADIIDLLD